MTIILLSSNASASDTEASSSGGATRASRSRKQIVPAPLLTIDSGAADGTVTGGYASIYTNHAGRERGSSQSPLTITSRSRSHKDEESPSQQSHSYALSLLQHQKRQRDDDNKKRNKILSLLRKYTNKTTSLTKDPYQDYTNGDDLKVSAAIFGYLVLGTLIFGIWVDGWNAVDAMYFTMSTITTVGYGDVYPESSGQRIFFFIFVTIGILILGDLGFSIVYSALFSSFQQYSSQNLLTLESKFMERMRFDYSSQSSVSGKSGNGKGRDKKLEKKNRASAFSLVYKNTLLLAAIFGPGFLIGYFEGWSIIDSIYYSFVTVTTVGYGDLSPKLMWTRLAAVFYLPLCIFVMYRIIGQITDLYMYRKRKEDEAKFFSRRLTRDDLRLLDREKDRYGSVGMDEFLEFMLVAMNKVDEECIENIKSLFRELDVKRDGRLDVSDVIAKAYGDDVVTRQYAQISARTLIASNPAGVGVGASSYAGSNSRGVHSSVNFTGSALALPSTSAGSPSPLPSTSASASGSGSGSHSYDGRNPGSASGDSYSSSSYTC